MDGQPPAWQVVRLMLARLLTVQEILDEEHVQKM
jgi:hypothetical protein